MGILTRRNIRKAKGLYPRPPCDCREIFSCGEGLPRQAVAQPTDKRHSRPSGASSVVKGENEIRACSPDRVFVMKNRTFVEFISKIRAAWLFLHIANKKLVPMRIKSRTSGLMQTPREISHTGNPTGGAGAHSAVLPAAHEEVVCTLQNIKVSVEYSPELADMLADTSKATVSLGDTSLDFSKTETRAAYFKPLALENTLNFAFDGTFADTGVPAKFSKQITGVKAGQWRKVSVVIGYADKGNILFSVKVDNSILQDNKFVVDGTENLGEELLEDPNAPALTWPGHDMTQPFTLTDAMFDAEGNCIEPFAFDLSSPNGIESLQVTVGSTNSQFLASMSAIQLPQTFDLCALDASSAAGIILKGFGYPVGSELKGQTAKSFNIAGQIRALYEFDGTHTFAFTMTDAKGVSSEAVLTLAVDKSSGQTGPRITWRGYDIDQQYEVQKDMVIDIDIEADKGIKSFFVTIDSETLRPLLPVINLPEKFDICDIPDELVEVLHGEFGFPINEQVKNRTSVTFSITKFVEILLKIPGEHNFVLDVTDNDNVLTHKTVKLIVH